MGRSRAYVNRATLAARADMSEILVKDLFDTILACVEEGIEVRITGFGTFRPVERTAGVPVVSPLINEGRPTPRSPGLTMRFRLSSKLRTLWRGVQIPRPLVDLVAAKQEIGAAIKERQRKRREAWKKAQTELPPDEREKS